MNLLYKKLQETYKKTQMHDYFPSYLLNNFMQFCLEQQHQNRKYLSPYKFANENKLPVKDSIKFFLFLANEEPILEIKYFFECSDITCGHRNFLSQDEIVELNGIDYSSIYCEECEKQYNYNDIKPFIKVYFEVILDENLNSDPNSTFDALEEMSSCVKVESPSFNSEKHNNAESTNEGDGNDGVQLQDLNNLNRTDNGEIISNQLQETLMAVYDFIKK